MDRRLKLQSILEAILGSPEDVHFQPPENVKMRYPSIVYGVDGLRAQHADNLPYGQKVEYQVTVIHRDPDNDIWRKVGNLPMCRMNRTSKVDNLNHYYFTLYF